MKPHLRNAVAGLFLVLILGSVIGWLLTGARGYTRFRDSEVESTNRQSELGDLFAEAGAEPLPQVESSNAIGLLPSGPGLASISVLTVGGTGAVGLVAVIWYDRRLRKRSLSNDEPLA